jgi:hypothetical protein
MANLTFEDELQALLDLVEFKQFVRYGHALYADYFGVLKPECTVSELVWGWCKNPCFANSLIHDLMVIVLDYPKVLGRANRSIRQKYLARDFDQAMGYICAKDGSAPVLAYSMQSTNPNDQVYEESGVDNDHYVRLLNATDEDGELWHGLLVSDEMWARGVESVTVSIYGGRKKRSLLWQHNFTGSSIKKRTRRRNDVVMFQPFKHPLPLMDLDITMVTKIIFKPEATDVDANQVFGIASNKFCDWLQRGKFEVKLCKDNVARINMRDGNIAFK